MNNTFIFHWIRKAAQILLKSLRIPSIMLLILTFVPITNRFAVDLVDAKDGLLGSNGMFLKNFYIAEQRELNKVANPNNSQSVHDLARIFTSPDRMRLEKLIKEILAKQNIGITVELTTASLENSFKGSNQNNLDNRSSKRIAIFSYSTSEGKGLITLSPDIQSAFPDSICQKVALKPLERECKRVISYVNP